ncbi:MAG: peptidoglycan binding domain-containing protein [Anaerolineae bacterium]|nr:peptidoglycan binding domain-containing protein [Anaerolineae bacterium]
MAVSGNSIPTQPMHRPPAPGDVWGCNRLSAGLLALLTLVLAAVCVFAAWVTLEITLGPYEGRIYPNVTVLGVDLGGLTPAEAAAALSQAAGPSDAGTVILSDGARTWSVRAADVGLSLNVDATVQAAFAVGRADQSWDTLEAIWSGRYDVAPVFVMDAAAAQAALERFAPQVDVAPVDASLRLEGDQLVTVPGQPGRRLDVQATLVHLLAVVSDPAIDNAVELAFTTVAPSVADAAAAQAEAEAMLARNVTLSAYDVLTDAAFTWTLGRAQIVTWLRVEPGENGVGLRVRTDPAAVEATLAAWAAQFGDGRGLRLDEASEQVVAAFEAGGGTVHLYLTHPVRSYVVQSGDRLTTIAARFGVPPGIIAEANPGSDLNWLQVGQQIVIPSQDELTPYLPTPGKRIVVSIAEQRMRVYENGSLIYDWVVSTGIETSPTYTGVFQILEKDENAYGSQWDLWMPHFLAIYRAGADVYNGIHALPILSSGQRLWERALGSPASYGCIILGVDEAETLYHWVDIGVVVVVE